MNLSEFQKSIQEDKQLPAALSKPLAALWWDAKDDWDLAHQLCQEEEGSTNGDWVHAYLHRKEGDDGNAGYWYTRCGKNPFTGTLDEEWASISKSLLGS